MRKCNIQLDRFRCVNTPCQVTNLLHALLKITRNDQDILIFEQFSYIKRTFKSYFIANLMLVKLFQCKYLMKGAKQRLNNKGIVLHHKWVIVEIENPRLSNIAV